MTRAVQVVTEWGDLRVPWEAGTTPVMLAPVSDLVALADEPDLARVLRAYDPQREVALVFLRADGGTSAYRVQPRLAPPQAYAELSGGCHHRNQHEADRRVHRPSAS